MYVTIPTENSSTFAFLPLCGTTTPQTIQTHLEPGAYLYYEGDEVEWLYQVTSGVVRLTRLLSDGRRQVIAFGYPGDIIGFPASGNHHTDCEALTDTYLQPYRRSILEGGASDPKLYSALLHAALNEISAMQDHFMMLGRKSANEKLSSFLCVLAARVGTDLGGSRSVNLPMSRSDIADFLGLTTETVSRTFTQLRNSKVITIENIHTVIIHRPTALLALSQGHHT
ncbi:MAG: helix-turn-helix domain-containing protein [Sulfitobacter sp.]